MKKIFLLFSFVFLFNVFIFGTIDNIVNITNGNLLFEYDAYGYSVLRYENRLIIQSMFKIEEMEMLANGNLERLSIFETKNNYTGYIDENKFYNFMINYSNNTFDLLIFDLSQVPMTIISRIDLDITSYYIPSIWATENNIMITDFEQQRTVLLNKETHVVDGYINGLYGLSDAINDILVWPTLHIENNQIQGIDLRFYLITDFLNFETQQVSSIYFQNPNLSLSSVNIVDDKVLITHYNGLIIVNIEDIMNPFVMYNIPSDFPVASAIIEDGKIFISNDDGALKVYEIDSNGTYSLLYEDIYGTYAWMQNMHYQAPYLYMNKGFGLKVYDIDDDFNMVLLYGKSYLWSGFINDKNDLYYIDYNRFTYSIDIYSVLENSLICNLQYDSNIGNLKIKIIDDTLYVSYNNTIAGVINHMFEVYYLDNQQAELMSSFQVSNLICYDFILTENQIFFANTNPLKVTVYNFNGHDIEYDGSFLGRFQSAFSNSPDNFILNLHNNRVIFRDINDYSSTLFSHSVTGSSGIIDYIDNSYYAISYGYTGNYRIFNYNIEDNYYNMFYNFYNERVNTFNKIITINAFERDVSEYYSIINGQMQQIGEKYDDKNVVYTYFFPERHKMVQICGSGIHLYDIEYTVSESDQVVEHKRESFVYPNPVNGGEVNFKTTLNTSQMEISIYNVKGQLVKRSKDFQSKDGETTFSWNKKNEQNQTVASGVYFYKIKTDKAVQTGKFLIIK